MEDYDTNLNKKSIKKLIVFISLSISWDSISIYFFIEKKADR